MDKIPTADSFLYTRNPSPLEGRARDTVILLMQEFAQLHVKAALKAANEVASKTDMHMADDDVILNAYPLTNIK